MVPHTLTVASVASVRALYVKHYKKGVEERGEGKGRRERGDERGRGGLNARLTKAHLLGCLGMLMISNQVGKLESELY